jgi:molecular chaperone DnaK
MTSYIGIDLGTTNSVICSYDGESVRLFKSPDQNDVTPSAIYVDPRGNRLYGKRAYDNAARDPDRAATLFKRFMGTSTPVKLAGANADLTPEQCSAEILRVLFGYLPEQLRQDSSLGTVITVPAAFDQLQKQATLTAAELAGIGAVALLQEPVAAVMTVMRQRKADGRFIVYDFGGGTLDVAIAHSVAGRVSLLSHGGIAMCGGRDFDRLLLSEVVVPWLQEHFALPGDLATNSKYKKLMRLAVWAVEKAKIELSAAPETMIALTEAEAGTRDEKDAEIYLDISLTRDVFDRLIESQVEQSIVATRDAIEKAQLSPSDIERIVFVGGPTQYKPMRDKVASAIGVPSSTDVNPMTAVAEGAAVFAESIEWRSAQRGRKSTRGSVAADGTLNLALNFVARTPDAKARVSLKVDKPRNGATFELNSLDTGWSSGRAALRDGTSVDVALAKMGENTFKIFVFDANGGPIAISQPRFSIVRTAAVVDAIPSSSSIGFEIDDPRGGRPRLSYIVREGDPLPKKGQIRFGARESVRAGTTSALRFKLWEGELEEAVESNRKIGELVISGKDLESDTIAAGAELICEYEVGDSGNVHFEVSVPSIGGRFSSERGLYSRHLAQVDFATAAERVREEAKEAQMRVVALSQRVTDQRIKDVSSSLQEAARLDGSSAEENKRASDRVLEARRTLAVIRNDHLSEMRQSELQSCMQFFNSVVRKFARPAETGQFDNMAKTAQRAIDANKPDFEVIIDEMKTRNFEILWRQDYFVVDRFNTLTQSPSLYVDKAQFAELVKLGKAAIAADDAANLRQVVATLYSVRVRTTEDDNTAAPANIVRTG